MSSLVRDNKQLNRYEMPVEDDVAFITYRRTGAQVALLHAAVPARLAGRGLGSALVKGALELARAEGIRVVPLCSFIAAYIDRHAEYRDLLA